LQQNIVPDVVTGERIFEQLDRDKNGELEFQVRKIKEEKLKINFVLFQEFVRVEMLNKQNKTLEGYVETIFELYDTDGDGTISRQEIVDFCKR
jgi:Ca2+-binding EF-hand superfamily protein